MAVFNGLLFNRDVDLSHNVVAVGKRMENGKHFNSQFNAAALLFEQIPGSGFYYITKY